MTNRRIDIKEQSFFYLKPEVKIRPFLVSRNATNWSPDWCPEVPKSIYKN